MAASIPCLHAQDEVALRNNYEGTTVPLKVDMPGTADGVNVYPKERLPFDFQAYRRQIDQYGIAIPRGKQAVITRIRVKKNLIEVQFDGGGYGTFNDLMSSASNQLSDSAQRALRAKGGSRFNLRYQGAVPSDQLTPDAVKQALARYVDFSPPPAAAMGANNPTATGAPTPEAASPALRSPAGAPATDARTVPSTPPTQVGVTLPTSVSASWRARVGWDHQVFPSYVIATASLRREPEVASDSNTLGDPNSQIAVILTAPAAGVRVTVTVSSPGLMEPTTFDAVLPVAGRSYAVAPTIAWDFSALARNHQTRPASITVSVAFNGATSSSVVERITLRSVNDCPYYALVEDGLGRPHVEALWWMFAAYVNENHPFSDQLRKEALDAGIVRNFTGYQTGDPQEVVRQVYAIWNVLQKRGFKYSNITTTAAESRYVRAQQVRFLDESMKGAQANCVDGSVLFASVMRQ